MRRSLVCRLLQQASKEFSRFHSVSRVVRTSVHAAWLRKIGTKVARRRLLLDRGFFLALFVGQIRRYVERVHVDIAVRAIFSAETAADAPIFDNYFQRIPAANRSHGAADHAKRIEALAAGSGNQVVVKTQSFAHETRHSVMSVGASEYAGVTTRAAIQIQQQQALRFHQTLCEKTLERRAADH